MNICFITLYAENYERLAEVTLPVMQDYCKEHRYDLCAVETEVLKDNSYGFSKVRETQQLLPKYDVVACFDIDILITNQKIKLESFIDKTHDLFITTDINGINAGSFIVKNTEGGRWWMDFILSKTGEFQNEQNVIEKYKDDKVKILPHPSINSLPYEFYYPNYGQINGTRDVLPSHKEGCWRPNDFCCHVPGIELNQRIDILNSIKELCEITQ